MYIVFGTSAKNKEDVAKILKKL